MLDQVLQSIEERIVSLDWSNNSERLCERGYVELPRLITAGECRELVNLYPDEARFRSCINMSRYRTGEGTYKYFRYPLPDIVQELREHIYRATAGMANQWNDLLGFDYRFLPTHNEFLEQCRHAGQRKPTPMLLRFKENDYACLHQDLYGRVVFPLRLTVFLSEPDVDYTGGDFVIAEQRPRAESRVQVLRLRQGEAVIFTTRSRPTPGSRGHRVNVRHGVSPVRSGSRFTLSVSFHDAE